MEQLWDKKGSVVFIVCLTAQISVIKAAGLLWLDAKFF